MTRATEKPSLLAAALSPLSDAIAAEIVREKRTGKVRRLRLKKRNRLPPVEVELKKR